MSGIEGLIIIGIVLLILGWLWYKVTAIALLVVGGGLIGAGVVMLQMSVSAFQENTAIGFIIAGMVALGSSAIVTELRKIKKVLETKEV